MASIHILNERGDTAIRWSAEAYVAKDRDAVAAVREAERIMAQARKQGASAFAVKPGELARRIDKLEPGSEQNVVIVPRIAGG
ncbi:hypothetical protein [Devosia sp.]|uniref:hypothetical protein n=1 Tax=Devosia sp. TaxID=1871048 RepID=UPI00273651AB|nr:hypothetical protein [Devosia sp.]MDP2779765.1 hypothetical protein [Devosia sp.]